MTEKHDHGRQRQNPDAPVTNIVIYTPKPGRGAELLALIRQHEPALREVGLVTNDAFRVWKVRDIRKDRERYIEQFVWKNGGASDIAHQAPQVMAVWEPMGAVLEDMMICEAEAI